jgi:hypothetical protein
MTHNKYHNYHKTAKHPATACFAVFFDVVTEVRR